MSHFTTIETQIRDVEALRAACNEMGLGLVSNGQARGYGERKIAGEHVIVLKGPYDIALNRKPDGTYHLTTDWWDGHVEKEVGKNFGRLLQLYGVHKAMQEVRRKGYTVSRFTLKDGSIKLNVVAA
jgi:hypothetical protein